MDVSTIAKETNCTCKSHRTKLNYGRLTANAVLRSDPTYTVALRQRFSAEATRRWRKISRDIVESVVVNDVFGLLGRDTSGRLVPLSSIFTNEALPPKLFAFDTNPQKTEKFMKWLRDQTDRGILMTTPGEPRKVIGNVPWANTYIDSAYKRGMKRGKAELKKAGIKPSILGDENRGLNLDARFNQPFHADKVAQVYLRTYSALKGITEQTEQIISQELALGLAEGQHPRQIARRMTRAIEKAGQDIALRDPTTGRTKMSAGLRSRIMARTEVIRAHHVANINTYREAGVEGVKVKAEWSTAGDDRVCPDCLDLEGQIFTLEEIEPLIPLHPQCRCVALPVVDSFTTPTKGSPSPTGGLPTTPTPSPKKKPTKATKKQKGTKGRGKAVKGRQRSVKSVDEGPEAISVPPFDKNPGGYFRANFKLEIGYEGKGREQLWTKYKDELIQWQGSELKARKKFDKVFDTAEGWVKTHPERFAKKPKVKKPKTPKPASAPTAKAPTAKKKPGEPLTLDEANKLKVKVKSTVEPTEWTEVDNWGDAVVQLKEYGWCENMNLKMGNTSIIGKSAEDVMTEGLNKIGKIYEDIDKRFPGVGRSLRSKQGRIKTIGYETSRNCPVIGREMGYIDIPEGAGGYFWKAKGQIVFSNGRRIRGGQLKIDDGTQVVGFDLQSITRHEIGHQLHARMKTDQVFEWLQITDDVNFKKWISKYSADNSSEGFAEAFGAWTNPLYGTPGLKRMPTIVEGFMKRYVDDGAKGFYGGQKRPKLKTATPKSAKPAPKKKSIPISMLSGNV